MPSHRFSQMSFQTVAVSGVRSNASDRRINALPSGLASPNALRRASPGRSRCDARASIVHLRACEVATAGFNGKRRACAMSKLWAACSELSVRGRLLVAATTAVGFGALKDGMTRRSVVGFRRIVLGSVQQTSPLFAYMAAKTSKPHRDSAASVVDPVGVDDLDRIDRRILKLLQDDGRMSVTEIARQVSLSVTPCLARVRRLEIAGFIRGYFAELDPERLGLGLQAFVTVNLDRTTPDVFDRFRLAMLRFDEVVECQMVGGGFDYLVKVRVRDMKAFRKFLGQCMTAESGVQQTHTYFVMEEIKSTHRLKVQA